MSLLSLKNQSLSPFLAPFDFWNSLYGDRQPTIDSYPAANVAETDQEYKISVAVPGLEKEDITIDVQDDVLMIEGNKESTVSDEDEGFTRKEYSMSSFKRTFVLPQHVDISSINASCKNGELLLTIPKIQESKKEPKRISVS